MPYLVPMMAVGSLIYWFSKLSTRIRDYSENLDSNHRGISNNSSSLNGRHDHNNHHHHQTDQRVDESQITTLKKNHHSNHHHKSQHCCNSRTGHDCIKAKCCANSSSKSRHNSPFKSYDGDCPAARNNQNSQQRSLNTSQLISSSTTGQTKPPLLAENNNVIHIPPLRSTLPHGFKKKVTSQGQVFFVDLWGNKYWFDPCLPRELYSSSLDLDKLIGKLSSNWEIRHTSSGRTYFVNHFKKTTQFTDPRMVAYKDYLMDVLRQKRAERDYYRQQQAFRRILLDQNPRQFDSLIRSPIRQTDSIGQSNCNPDCSSQNHNQNQSHNSQQKRNRLEQVEGQGSTICKSREENQISQFHDPAASSSNLRRASRLALDEHSQEDLGNCMRENLIGGSYHNLNEATFDFHASRSNTMSGLKPEWFKRAAARNFKDRYGHHRPTVPAMEAYENEYDDLSCEIGYNLDSSDITNHHLMQQQQQQQRPVTELQNEICPTSANNSDNNVNHNIVGNYDMQQSQQQNTPRVNKELYDKISILRQELLQHQILTHPCKIEINRKRIFEESYRVISRMEPKDLKKRLLVKFRGEEGLDYGGVAREWFYMLSREILNPIHGLFQYTSDDIYNLQINPDSGIVYKEHLSYLNFCGRIIGMAVFNGHFIEGHFTLPFYKMLLRKSITLKDIEFVDPELHRSLCWILKNDITDVIDTTFSVEHNAFGQLQEHELKENGKNINVTEDNKHEYVSLYVNYRCRRGIENQSDALRRGFYELIPASLLESFDEYELELLIGGLSKLDIEDWRLNTKLKNCNVETPLIKWFWSIVKSYGEDKRARLLQFVTGSPRVPIQGFKALQGVNSELRLFTIHLIRSACTDDLPKSHTCFNRIDLPPYESYEKLRDKLTQAIEETMGFAMQ